MKNTVKVLSIIGTACSSCFAFIYNWDSVRSFSCDFKEFSFCREKQSEQPPSDDAFECDRRTSAGWDTFRQNKNLSVDFSSIDPWPAIKISNKALDKVITDKDPSNNRLTGRIQFQIGRAYDVLAQNEERYFDIAKNYYQLARANSYWPASINLGILFEDGHIRGQKNEKQASLLYQEAAMVNIPQGNYCYAITLVFGWKYDHDEDRAVNRRKDRAIAVYALERIIETFPETEPYIISAKELLNDINTERDSTIHFECNKERNINFRTPDRKRIPK